MNHRLLTTVCLLVLLVYLGSCSQRSDENEVRAIFAEIGELQDQEETLVKELMGRDNIWHGEQIEEFPQNRSELQPIAQLQLNTLSRIIELEEKQIEKIRGIGSVTSDKNLLPYAELQRRTLEKRLESNKLAIQRFRLISDPIISNKEDLHDRLAKLKALQDQVDKDIGELGRRMAEHRNRAND